MLLHLRRSWRFLTASSVLKMMFRWAMIEMGTPRLEFLEMSKKL